MKHHHAPIRSFVPAVLGLLAALVVPTLHGPIVHHEGAYPGAEGSQEARIETSAGSHAHASSAEACPICAVSARGRRALPAPLVVAASTPAQLLHHRPADAWRLEGVADWAPAAPRAPPAFV